jgi:hypothetical protein
MKPQRKLALSYIPPRYTTYDVAGHRKSLQKSCRSEIVDLAQLRQLAHDLIGDYVESATVRLQPDDALNPEHEEIIASLGSKWNPY